ncbi:MAG: hypothetical protein HYZ16_03010 [Bacteroidetes bacterium]|nr:hypothetical protein [Bacteroidota bacterium]
MMKSILILACWVAGTAAGWTQITITSQHLPKAGDFFVRDSVRNNDEMLEEFINVDFETGFAHWDASTIVGWKPLDTIRFSNPKGTVYADSIPTANMLMNWEYDFVMEKDTEGLKVLGIGLNGVVNKFDSAVNFFPVPMVYGQSDSSRGKSAFSYFGMDISVEMSKHISVISYGTLKMPDDSTYDVLLARSFTWLKYLIVNGKDTLSYSDSFEISVDFYSKEYGFPLLRVVLEPFTLAPIAAEILDLDSLVGISHKEQDRNEVPNVWPNPVARGNTLYVNSELPWEQAVLVALDGQHIPLKMGMDNRVQMPLVPTGLYVLKLTGPQAQQQVLRVEVVGR